MTQFASTLYPQTNPTNPVLLRFRENPNRIPTQQRADHWVWYLKSPFSGEYSTEHCGHAIRVLTRLAALTG